MLTIEQLIKNRAAMIEKATSLGITTLYVCFPFVKKKDVLEQYFLVDINQLEIANEQTEELARYIKKLTNYAGEVHFLDRTGFKLTAQSQQDEFKPLFDQVLESAIKLEELVPNKSLTEQLQTQENLAKANFQMQPQRGFFSSIQEISTNNNNITDNSQKKALDLVKYLQQNSAIWNDVSADPNLLDEVKALISPTRNTKTQS